MLVGILSDTHVYDRAQKLNPRVVETFRRRGVELILHAGDLTSRDVLEELSRLARVVAVQGNMDACYGTTLGLIRHQKKNSPTPATSYSRGIKNLINQEEHIPLTVLHEAAEVLLDACICQ